jgi:hypothetical protein
MNINVDSETLKNLENAENDTTVPNVTINTELGTLHVLYDNETIDSIGTIYLADDKSLYLKFANSKNEKFAYKISDGITF